MTTELDSITIAREQALKPGEDYRFLREQGLQYIRELASKIWTDHNSHDPGVSIMELLCFAITDLSYRTNFDMKDLLALSSDERTSYNLTHANSDNKSDLERLGLFEAHKALTTAPLTIIDYRKLLIKIDKIQNAWLYPHCDLPEVKYYGDCESNKLTFNDFVAKYKVGNTEKFCTFVIANAPNYVLDVNSIEFLSIGTPTKIDGNNYTIPVQFSYSNGDAEISVTEVMSVNFFTAETSFPTAGFQTMLSSTLISDPWKSYWKRESKIVEGKIYPIYPRGLYDVRIALQVDAELGPLNERHLTFKIPKGVLKGVVIMFEVPNLPEDVDEVEILGVTVEVNDENPDDLSKWKVTFGLAGSQFIYGTLYVLDNKPHSNQDPILVDAEDLADVFIDSLHPEGTILNAFFRKIGIIRKAISNTYSVLQANRNLCEDFIRVDVVETQNVGICLDIETKNGGDLELLQAQMALKLEEYFNPPVKSYTLKEMLEEGFPSDEIFDGPYIDYEFGTGLGTVFSKAGFLKSDEVAKSGLRSKIYVSDIINILMDFDDVITVKDVMVRMFDKYGNAQGPAERWELDIPLGKQPVLKLSLSKFLFFKGEIPYTAKVTEAEDTLNYLRAEASKSAYVPFDQVFDIPTGRSRNLGNFFPIQHDLPDCYGTSPVGIPFNATETKKRDVKNTKAYLLFFEQLVADYLMQLNNVKWLLSPDNTLTQSYFTKYIQDGDIAPLENSSFISEYYVYNSNNTSPLLADVKIRQNLYETDLGFLRRRNDFLDHLLARFAESFADYSMMLFKVTGDVTKSTSDLIADKCSFLEDYPTISRERSKGYNYSISPVWDTDVNISGLEKRFGRLLGLANMKRRDLSCKVTNNSVSLDVVVAKTVGAQQKLVIRSWGVINQQTGQEGWIEIATSTKSYPNDANLAKHMESLSLVIREYSKYSYDSQTLQLVIPFKNGLNEDDTMKSVNTYATKDAFNKDVKGIFKTYDRVLNAQDCFSEAKEGMFMIEHILLRPMIKSSDNALMSVCLDADCECKCQEPYSFQVSVFLPYWPGRFNNLDFRNFFERALREEMPSHIMLKICWINNYHMQILEDKYFEWIDAKAHKSISPATYNQKLINLIDIMSQVRTVYPDATLHDCEEDGGDRPVLLGKTSLGSF